MGAKGSKNTNSEDAALFREAVGDAQPVKNRRVQLRRPPPVARARFRRRDEADVLAESLRTPPEVLGNETGEELSFRRPSVSDRDFRRLRAGQVAIQAWLDLHGLTSVQARGELSDFIDECLRRGLRCVGVVHGKGKRS
jgi:DNA-nicking Smr family endonuclease